MKRYALLLVLSVTANRAVGSGPPSPASLLPPLNSGKSIPTIEKKPVPNTPDFDPIFDLEDPSTLLEMDRQGIPDPEPPKKSEKEVAYDKKLQEASNKLLKPNEPKFRPLTPLPQNQPLIPLLPLLATKKENTPLPLKNRGPTPLLPAPIPPHPPLLAAMNPPPIAPPSQPQEINLMPMVAGLGQLLAANREPNAAANPQNPPTPPAQVTQLLPVPKGTALAPLSGVPDIAIILSNNHFYPSKIRLKEGTQTRLIFTTTNKKPAALVMEKLQIQRWIAKEKDPNPASELERAKWEVNREVSSTKVTEIVLDPKEGTYSFHDAISGASGEIEVEKK